MHLGNCVEVPHPFQTIVQDDTCENASLLQLLCLVFHPILLAASHYYWRPEVHAATMTLLSFPYYLRLSVRPKKFDASIPWTSLSSLQALSGESLALQFFSEKIQTDIRDPIRRTLLLRK